MTMSFLLHESPSEIESSELSGPNQLKPLKRTVSAKPTAEPSSEKFRIPESDSILERPRLLDLIERSVMQYGATLVSGRAGTGKTVLASSFARKQADASWFSIEPADCDWREFSSNFLISLRGKGSSGRRTKTAEPDELEISEFVTRYLRGKGPGSRRPRLLVLDNLHYVFDSRWFSQFFREMVVSLDQHIRLLILCRSTPSSPLWRLRSKQMLNLIDENLLNFTDEEVRELCRSRGVSTDHAAEINRRSFGNVYKTARIIDELYVLTRQS